MADQAISDFPGDIVTPLATAIMEKAGGSAYRQLVVRGGAPKAAHPALDGITPGDLISRPITNPDEARAALAGLWLWHDALEESHAIAQEIVLPTGSFWHAILHRREGDFSNAKYWYRRCESHHVNKLMGAVASSLASELASDPAVAHAVGDGWNPIGFVDLVQAVHGKPDDPRHELAVRLQRVEWEGLFNYCVRQAVADNNAGNLDAWDRRITDPSGG